AAAPRSLHSFPTRRSSDLDFTADLANSYLRVKFDALTFYDERVAAQLFPQRPLVVTVHAVSDHHLMFAAHTWGQTPTTEKGVPRSEEHTSELQSRENLVCR